MGVAKMTLREVVAPFLCPLHSSQSVIVEGGVVGGALEGASGVPVGVGMGGALEGASGVPVGVAVGGALEGASGVPVGVAVGETSGGEAVMVNERISVEDFLLPLSDSSPRASMTI